MSKHTPGPWNVGVEGNGTPGYVYCDNSLGSAVAICYGKPLSYSGLPRSQEIANARLIAAAPELLAALKRIAEFEGEPLTPVRTAAKMKAIARAAIAKAEGGQDE